MKAERAKALVDAPENPRRTPGPTLVPALVDLDALARVVAPLVVELLQRPLYVTQRTAPTVLGMPRGNYLDHCRAGDWLSFKDRRLVYAKTEDVAAFLAARPVEAKEDAEGSEEARTLARVGARRVA